MEEKEEDEEVIEEKEEEEGVTEEKKEEEKKTLRFQKRDFQGTTQGQCIRRPKLGIVVAKSVECEATLLD
ncbi:hypothetical protein PoB_002237700 [Plakobranchus ocellatus]|uniref:Uncharacterized protein n=1 Tax=Plakobranchus ocellatus TaxID=259542 RepID=A0AAV3ZMX6_9GAST|nr:hypothetical protein PoB_002237700 [Plakobranchus ocellatus]